MQGWRGLVVLAAGVVIGAGLWAGLSELARLPPPQPRLASTESPPAGPPPPPPLAANGPGEGVTGAVKAAAGATTPPHPIKIAVQGADLAALLTSAPYVHRGLKGPALYVVTFRDCPACLRFEKEAWGPLEADGVDVRWIVYARRDLDGHSRSQPAERALVAELALNRNYDLLDRWLKSAGDSFYTQTKLPPAADSSPQRSQALETTRALVDALNGITSANGDELAIPSFFWQASDGWHALIGYDKSAFAKVKASLLARTVEGSSG
jgi:hypothetical protein